MRLYQFYWSHIYRQKNGYVIHRKIDIATLKPLNEFSDFLHLQALRAQLSSAANSRSDIACHFVLIKHVKNDLFHIYQKHVVKQIIGVVRHL